MEIDFLGLNSPKRNIVQQGSKDAFTDSANEGVETSLSLSTSSSLDCQTEFLNFYEKKRKTWEFPSDKMIPSCSGGSLAHYNQETGTKTEQPSLVLVPRPVFHTSPTTGFLYDLNDRSSNLRKISEHPAETASLTMLYSGCSNVFNDTLPEKADNTMYMAGNPRICTRGHTPTVAMARRATLARFLEKRLHRMKQARLMGKSLNTANSEKTITTNNSLIRS